MPLLAFSQGNQAADVRTSSPAHTQLLFVPSADCARQGVRLAEDDLARGAPVLLLQGGISPVVYPSDSAFEQRFGVQYFDEGCSAPSKECMMAYNARIFRYLQRNYAKAWWKDMRKDVIGFKEWKKSAK
ncbi:hypothetical protein ACFQT0_10820 [Hymenobacter humi]|uniref:Uncharacterized protein n=1 Tax=Hymenobacter humi TaxID=1411620 RepID=A0ABW2U464_9BACT